MGIVQVCRESMWGVCKLLEDVPGAVSAWRFEDWQGGAADAARDDLLVLLGQLGVVMDSGDDALLALDTAIAVSSAKSASSPESMTTPSCPKSTKRSSRAASAAPPCQSSKRQAETAPGTSSSNLHTPHIDSRHT